MSRQKSKHVPGKAGLAVAVAFGAVVLALLLGLLGVNRPNRDKEQFESSVAAGYEKRDLSVRGIVIFLAALVIMLGLVFVVTNGVMLAFTGHPPPLQYPPQGLSNAPTPDLPPEPRLEAVPGAQNEQSTSSEEQKLNSYGWIDQKAGVVRIPIDRALDLLLQRGLPTRQQTPNQFQDQGQSSPSVPSSGRQMEQYP